MSAISLHHFLQTAQRAHDVGGSLDINKNNELVVKGSTWLGRQVLWLKQHLFPSKMRQQNQKVLDAFNKTLRSGNKFHVDLSFSRSLGTVEEFTQKVATTARVAHEYSVREQYLAKQKEQAREEFDIFQRDMVTDADGSVSARLQSALAYMHSLSGSDEANMRTRYEKLVGSIAADRVFDQEGKIPGGSGTSYHETRSKDVSSEIQIAAYFMLADGAYEKGGGEPRISQDHGELYGLKNEAEVAWVRQKLQEVS